MKKIMVMTLALLPSLAFAQYDAERIKADVTAEPSFKVADWKLNDTKTAWVAEHDLKDTVLTVGKEESGMIFVVDDNDAALTAMINCMLFGNIGLELDDNQIANAVSASVKQGQKQVVEANGSAFSVKAEELVGNVALSCVVAPN